MIRMIPFTDTTDSERAMILVWRNHDNVRRWMLTQNPISLEEHLRFIESLKKRSDKCYFLVKKGDEYIGVIDFNSLTKNSAEFGIYANPDLHGIGNTLMDQVINYAFNTLGVSKLTAKVFSDNLRAKYLYEKFDFTETTRITHNGREMICMERTHEHR